MDDANFNLFALLLFEVGGRLSRLPPDHQMNLLCLCLDRRFGEEFADTVAQYDSCEPLSQHGQSMKTFPAEVVTHSSLQFRYNDDDSRDLFWTTVTTENLFRCLVLHLGWGARKGALSCRHTIRVRDRLWLLSLLCFSELLALLRCACDCLFSESCGRRQLEVRLFGLTRLHVLVCGAVFSDY